MSMAPLFLIAKMWKRSERLSGVVYIYIIEDYSAILITCKNMNEPENIMLGDRNQSQNATECMIPFI